MKKKLITIKDVSKKSGFSITTVSRALGDFDDVNIETKKYIKKVAKELGYFRNKNAVSLVKRQNRSIGLIVSGLERDGGKDNIFYSLMSGMYHYAETIDYEVLIYTTNSAQQQKISYIQFCMENNIAGAILNGIRKDDPFLQELFESEIPTVLIDVNIPSSKAASVSVDNVQAACDAVTYLIQRGLTRIGMISGRKEAFVSQLRLDGYLKAIKENNLKVDYSLIKTANFNMEQAYHETIDLLNEHPNLQAIFCASDLMAFGAYKGIKEKGFVIGKDISVIGFDDIPLAQYMDPPLTTVCQDFYLMGYKAAAELIHIVNGESVPQHHVLEHHLIVRESTK